MNKTETKVQSITFLAHAMCHIYILTLPAILLPIAKHFNLSLTQITGISTICFLLFGLGSVPAGFLTNLINPKKMLLIFFSGCALSSFLIGISPNVLIFTICIAMLGLFNSIYHVAGPTLVSFNTLKIGKSYGILGVGGSAGITLAPFIASIITQFFGWQFVYLFLAIPGLFGFFWLYADKLIPLKHVFAKQKTKTKHNPKFWLLIFVFLTCITIQGFIYSGFLTIFPTFLSQKVHLAYLNPLLTGGFLSTIILAIGMLGQYFGGIYADKINNFKLYLILQLITLPFFFLMGFTTGLLLVLIGLCFSLFYFPFEPVENSLAVKLASNRFVGPMFGFKFVLTFGLGSLGAVCAGFITEQFGISRVFLFLSCVWILPLILVLLMYFLQKSDATINKTVIFPQPPKK